MLSVFYNGGVCEYQIRRHGEDAFFSINDNKIHGLDALIEYYQEFPEGLVIPLSTYVKKDLPPHDARRQGNTNLIHRATKESNRTVVAAILKDKNRSLDAKNQEGQTALHIVAIHSNEEILKLLLSVDHNVNCRDTIGNTPLHVSISKFVEIFYQ